MTTLRDGAHRTYREVRTTCHEQGGRVDHDIATENEGNRWMRTNEVIVRAEHAQDFERYCRIGKAKEGTDVPTSP